MIRVSTTFDECAVYFMIEEELEKRARLYCDTKGMRLVVNPILGFGSDGRVWRTSAGTAVKAFEMAKCYTQEQECYRRLSGARVVEIDGLAVPAMEGFDDKLMVVEMSIVQKPYLLDFGKVHLDKPPPYYKDANVMSDLTSRIEDDFGDQAFRIYGVLSTLTSFGIWYTDPSCRNICLEENE